MRIGVVDTTFARVDMFPFVDEIVKKSGKHIQIERYTVPGIKDIPVACKILFDAYQCEICIALGMPGDLPIDKQCSHEASLAIGHVQLMASKHILEVFVHMDEGKNGEELYAIAKDRASKHAQNALALLDGKTTLQNFAGKGRRQGKADVGPVRGGHHE